jgi:hypothetical protein
MDLGFQVDPVASTTSAAILIGSVWGYMHMINLSKRRQWRDVEAQSLRTAKVMVLTGKMDPDTYERAVEAAERSSQEYEAAKTFTAKDQARIPHLWNVVPQLLRRHRLPRVRASLSSLPDQPGEEDQLLQDFKDHLRKVAKEDGSSSSS